MCAFKRTTGNHPQNHLRTLLATLALPALLWTGGCSGGIHDVTSSPGSASSELLVERPKELRPEAGHVAPPAGGTTVVSRDSSVAVVSEPVLSQLLIVDLKTKAVTKRIELRPGDNPGRCVEGAVAGEFFCVLRTGSAVVRIRAQQEPWVPLQRVFVCAEPRGIAFAQTDQTLRVACDGGELVTMQTQRGALLATFSQQLEAGLDDVLLMTGAAPESEVWVSRKRRAKVFRLSRTSGKLLGTTEPPSDSRTAATTAARLLRDPRTGGAFLLHEVGSLLPLLSWGGGCVNCDPSLRAVDPKGEMSPNPLKLVGASPLGGNERLTVPLDMAIRGDSVAVVAAGNRPLSGGSDRRSTVWLGDRTKLSIPISLDKSAMPIAVAATQDRFVVQTIGRSSLWLVSDSQRSEEIVLDPRPQSIRGVELYYGSNAAIGLACASCHPGGQDDGNVWEVRLGRDEFRGRSMNLLGTLEGRSAYRHGGKFSSLQTLVDSDLKSINQERSIPDSASLTAWLLALKAPWVMAPASDATQIAHGKALFEASCASCHGTDKPTSHKVSLSKGEPELVSPLLTDLNNRAPYLHDGCATTLDMVFDGTCPLAGDVHRLPNSNTVERSRLQALRAYLTRR
jgi:hypothetical protein